MASNSSDRPSASSVELIAEYTNSANADSASTDVGGVSFKGDQFIVPLIGLLLSFLTLMLITAFSWFSYLGQLGQIGVSAIWVALSVVWMMIFVVGRPVRYQNDFFTQLRKGGNIETGGSNPWESMMHHRRTVNGLHPLREIQRRRLKRHFRELGVPKQDLRQLVEESISF